MWITDREVVLFSLTIKRLYKYSTIKYTLKISYSTLDHKCPGKIRDIIDAIIIRKTISGP